MASVNSGNLGGDLKGLLPMPLVVGLTDKVGRRRPIKELLEGLYLFVEGGQIVTKSAAGGGGTPSLLIPPPDSYAGSAGNDLTKFSAEGHSHLLNISPTALPLPNGYASIGNGLTYADIFHTHPAPPPSIPPDPAVTTATLYTAYVGDSNYHEVKYLMSNGQGLGFDMVDWDYIGVGTWQQKAPDYNTDGTVKFTHNYAIKGALSTGTGWSAPLAVGDRFFVPYVGSVDIVGGDDSRFWGVYEVVVQGEGIGPDGGGQGHPPGWHPTPGQRATIKRADFANTEAGICGLVVGITGDPLATNYGKFYRITNTPPFWVDNEPITLELLNSYTRIEKWEALTGPQLISEGASTAYIDQSVTAAGGSGGTFAETALPLNFDTLVGTPGVTSLAVGTYIFDVEAAAQNSGGSPGSLVILRAKLIDLDGGGGVILTADSSPVTAGGSRPEALRFSVVLTSPYSFAVPRRLRVKYYLWTNSDTPVLLGMRYNTPSRGTKITVPFAMGVTGAIDGVHSHLSGRSDPNQHPATAVSTDVTNFNHNLSSADDTVQKALDTLDNLIIPTPITPPTASTTIPVKDSEAGTAGTDTTQFAQKGHSHLLNISPTALPKANGVAAVGDGKTYADIFHTHPIDNPAATVYTLFPCYIPDPKLRRPARGLVSYGSTPIIAGFNQISGVSTFQAPTAYALTLASSGGATVFAQDHDIILAAIPGTITPSKWFGLWEVLDCGIHSPDGSPWPGSGPAVTSQAIVRRTTDANTPAGLCHGMVVQITGGSGVEHNGDYFTLSTDDPIVVDTTEINFSISSSYTSTPKSELLSSAQVLSEGSLGEERTATVPAASMFEPNGEQLGPTFTTLPLGLTSIPAGRFGAQMLLRNSVFTTTFVKVLWWIKHLDGSTTALAPFLTMGTSTTVPYDSLYYFEADLAAPVSLVPTDCVQVAAFTHAPSIDISMGQNVTWTFQNPSRDSWFSVTWQSSIVGGTNDHQLLLNRYVDVGAGTTASEHDWNGIGPKGRIHTKIGTATESSGHVTMPADASQARVSLSTQNLTLIDSTGFLDGDHVMIHITNASSGSKKYLLDGTPPTGAFYTLRLEAEDGGPAPISMTGPTTCKFWLDTAAQCWRLESLPVTYFNP